MRGAVLNVLGGTVADFPPFNVPLPATNQDLILTGAQEFCFWKWRTKRLRISGTITIDGVDYPIDNTMQKGVFGTGLPDDPIDLEKQMVCGFGGWSYQASYGSPGDPPPGVYGIAFNWFFYGKHVETSDFEKDWLAGFSFSFVRDSDAFGLTTGGFVAPSTPTDATITIDQDDPVLEDESHDPVNYFHSTPLYKLTTDTEVVTGDLTLEVYTGGDGWFTWNDVAGNPLYDADTGELL